jgi:RNA polymerase sigma factor (sigma-70 family)
MAAVPSRGYAAAAKLHVAPAALTTQDLYERFGRQIYRFCLQRLRNREEAEDATQTTFLNAFRGLERGAAIEFEAAWLYKIALHVCLSRQRAAGRGPGVELEAVQDRLPARESDHDELFGLDHALRQMPQQQRRALLLREWQGLSYREIGEALGLSQAAVETLLFRARRSLADGLSDRTVERRGRGRPRTTPAGGTGVTQLHAQHAGRLRRLTSVDAGTPNE